MLSTRTAGGALLSLLIFACVGSTPEPVLARQPAARPADQATIDRAIESGVRYLRATQNPAGSWGKGTGPGAGKGWGIGYTALAGVALVECGVPTTDPGLKRALALVRANVPELDQTYEVALAILFLDRMGEKSDRRYIQTLAARLVAGQTATGGWGYKLPKLSPTQQDQMFGSLRKMSAPQVQPLPSYRDRPSSLGLCIKASDDVVPRATVAFDPEKAKTAALAALPQTMKRMPVFLDLNELQLTEPKEKRNEILNPTTDNSNTHFAMLAVWAARKHDVPVERSLVLLANRFRTSQGSDGTWGYDYRKDGGGGSPALTCVALLGLAIGHVVDPDIAVRPEQDPRVVNAFVWLSKRIGEPVGTTIDRPTPMSAGGLYYMWAMERIAVLYDVRSLDKKDWYLWGAEILLCHQNNMGGWEKGGQHVEDPALSTSLALLFLKRANLTPDLSRRLVVDPSALTQKVSDTVTPKQPVTPTPKPPVTVEPTPEPKIEPPAPKPDPTPPVTTPTVTEPPPTTTTVVKKEESSKWPWILLLVVLAAVLAICVFMVVKKRKEAAEEEAKPRKKKKVKVKAEVDD
jgi:hypothetical protein